MLPPVRQEESRAERLRVTKRRATALLAVVGVGWIAITVFGGNAPWVGYVQATLEASLVGGFADWFAVTALFRHPLGLPIPHTAIIAARKDQFGATLGEFIQESFLTPEAIVERIRGARVIDRAAAWIASEDNARRFAGQVLDAAAGVADLAEGDELRDAIADLVRARVEQVDLAPLAGRALRTVIADGRHGEAVDAALQALDRYLESHAEELRARLDEKAPWWLPGAVEDRIFDRLLDGARALLEDMVGSPEHSSRRDLDAALATFAVRLQSDPVLRERGERLKQDLLAQPQLRDWASTAWRDVRAQLADPSSPLRDRLASSLASAAQRMQTDPSLRAAAEDGLERVASTLTTRFNGEIGGLVSATIERWDTSETSRRLELLLGPDLQYIRINGTVVGAGVGLLLHMLGRI